MNITRIASISGTVALTAIAVFVGRASTKFLVHDATNMFYTKAGACTHTNIAPGFSGTVHLTTGGTGAPAFLATAANTYAIFNTSTCTAAHRINANNL